VSAHTCTEAADGHCETCGADMLPHPERLARALAHCAAEWARLPRDSARADALELHMAKLEDEAATPLWRRADLRARALVDAAPRESGPGGLMLARATYAGREHVHAWTADGARWALMRVQASVQGRALAWWVGYRVLDGGGYDMMRGHGLGRECGTLDALLGQMAAGAGRRAA
jgi:hypothetical protein